MLAAACCGALLVAGLGTAAAGPAPAASGSPVPVIATGWDSPNPRQFREGLATFEGWGVFDGTTLRATRRAADGSEQAAIFAFSREPWAWGEFAAALADLKGARPTTCRENYLMVYSNPGDVDFHDAGKDYHTMASDPFGSSGGLRRLLFDAEPHHRTRSSSTGRSPSATGTLADAAPSSSAAGSDEGRAR